MPAIVSCKASTPPVANAEVILSPTLNFAASALVIFCNNLVGASISLKPIAPPSNSEITS